MRLESFAAEKLWQYRFSLARPRTGACKSLIMVGARRFEPPTPCTPCRCATKLRYAPTELEIIQVGPASRLRGNHGAVPSALEQLEDALQFLADVAGGDRLRNSHRLLRAAAARRMGRGP